MLVLTRKIQETINIGDDVEVKVLKISNDRVRIGIDAPDEVKIRRGELRANNQGKVAGQEGHSGSQQDDRESFASSGRDDDGEDTQEH